MTGVEAAVDVDDDDVGGAGVEHAEECGEAAEAGSVADGGGDGDDGAIDESADDGGEGAFHAGGDDEAVGASEGVEASEESVEAGDADVGEEPDVAVPGLGGDAGFLGDGEVAGAGGDDDDVAERGAGVNRGRDAEGSAEGVVLALGELALEELGGVGREAGGEGAVSVALEGVDDGDDLFGGFALPEDDLGEAAAHAAVEIDLGEVAGFVVEGGPAESVEGVLGGEGAVSMLLEEVGKLVGIHACVRLQKDREGRGFARDGEGSFLPIWGSGGNGAGVHRWIQDPIGGGPVRVMLHGGGDRSFSSPEDVARKPGGSGSGFRTGGGENGMASETRTGVEQKPQSVRKKSPGLFRLRIHSKPEDEEYDEELLTAALIRGWSVSVLVHVVVLVALAFIILKPPPKPPNEISTTLAGEEHGSMLSDQFTGGEGMDEPLLMPEIAEPTPAPQPTLTSAAVALEPELTQPKRPESGQEGVTRTGQGQAGANDGFGVVRFGHGGENINGVDVKVGDPQFTLIWDSRADLDLHVMEPGGSHLFWENRDGDQGGELDVDDVDGFGPENIYWGGGLDKGNGPPGQYKWYVHYYGAIGGVSVPTHWRVRVKHNGKYNVFDGKFKSIGQQSRTYSFVVGREQDVAMGAEAEAEISGAEGKHIGGLGKVSEKAPEAEKPEKPEGPPRDDSGWVIYASKEGDYEVHLPGEPSVERQEVNTRVGPLQMQKASVDRGEGGYAVSFLDYPGEATSDVERFLDEEVVRSIARFGGRLIEKKTLTVDGHQAREVTFGVPDSVVAGGGRSRTRLVLVGSRLYAVSVTGTKGFVERNEAEKFFRTFRLKGDR